MSDFNPEQFLRHLNDGLDPKQTAFSLRVSCQNAGALPAPSEEYQGAATAFRERLLELVREWVESGEDQEFDTDEPMERRVKLGTTTQLAIEKCWREHRVIPRVLPTGEVIRTIERSEPVPKVGSRHRPIEVMQGNAVAEFARLLNSSLRYKLSPCDKCSKYWFRERLHKRYYRDRRFCPECREAASSKLRMRKKTETGPNRGHYGIHQVADAVFTDAGEVRNAGELHRELREKLRRYKEVGHQKSIQMEQAKWQRLKNATECFSGRTDRAGG